MKYYRQNAPGHRLAEIFATQQLQGKINPQSSDSEVEKVLREEVQAAIDNSFNVVRTRIDKFWCRTTQHPETRRTDRPHYG